MEKLFENAYGYFTEDGKEYVITTPHTPRPWANVISNGDYSLLISQAGGGFSWCGSATENRLTRYFMDTVQDGWGKFLYLRDEENGECWSAAWQPLQRTQSYEVRHGMGYTKIHSQFEQIDSTLTMLVPRGEPMEIWKLTLKNNTDRAKKISVFSYFEWSPGDAPDVNREYHKLFIDTAYDERLRAVTARKYLWSPPNAAGKPNNRSWPYTAFHSCSGPVVSYECDKEGFIGRNRDPSCPRALQLAVLERHCGRYGDAVGALQTSVSLSPGEEQTLVFTLGCAEPAAAAALCEKYHEPSAADRALEEVRDYWETLLDKERIQTPDEALDLMTCRWLKYQAISCRLGGRSASYQINGGFGYRDQLQDSLIFLESDPASTWDRIAIHAEHQHTDGSVSHWWRPFSGAQQTTSCSDDFLWLPYVALCYWEETGEKDCWLKSFPFLEGESASLYAHCTRSIRRALDRKSQRGIPLMGAHDWNDGLNAVGVEMKGESFWVGMFLCDILKRFEKAARLLGDPDFANVCAENYGQLAADINKYGWDGQWYLQATTDRGEKLGAQANPEGSIFLNPQVWAVISGVAPKDRARTCMDAVSRLLLKDYGALLLAPAYTQPDEGIGYITRYAPGLRENGGVYTHAAVWAVMAYAMLGENEKAYEAFCKLCPPKRSADIEDYLAEPYVTPGNTDGPASPHYGRGSWSWYTGSAQWLHRAAVQYLLGVRPTPEGLRISPCLPESWNECRYERRFRGAQYFFHFVNCKLGHPRVILGGVPLEGDILPEQPVGGQYRVTVEF